MQIYLQGQKQVSGCLVIEVGIETPRQHEEILGSNNYVHYPDCGNGFKYLKNHQILYTLNMCSYTLIKLQMLPKQ